MERLVLWAAAFAVSALQATHAAPSPSPRPEPRPASLTVVAASPTGSERELQRWIDSFKGRAARQGIRPATLEAAFRDVHYNASIIEKDRNQSEFTKQIWDYLDSAASETRVRNGQAAMREHGRTLAAIEARYGVEAEVVAAVWGLESAYGSHRGNIDIIEALANLAHEGRRGKFFEEQLIAALKIVQSGDVRPRDMRGSWAGAMGHTQFIPTSYLAYAVDFRGDGKRDIWSDDPTDALASTAAYLAHFGWRKGQPWGVEVALPRGFDYSQTGERIKRSPTEWAAMGVRDMSGRPVRDYGRASILLPAGAQGAAFMIFDNFHVIERYNTADAYVIGVGHLSDRIKGGPPVRSGWPRGDRNLAFAEKQEMQKRLTAAGFNTDGVDGIIGPNTINAIRRFQRSQGLIPDGYASYEILRRLR